MAAWDHFLLVWASLFFVPIIFLFADWFYRQYVSKAIELNNVATERVSVQVAEAISK